MILVLLEVKTKTYTVYDGKVAVESWTPEDGKFLSREDVEALRVGNYAEKA